MKVLNNPAFLSLLQDIDLTGISNNKILKYNSTSENWEVADESSGGSGSITELAYITKSDYQSSNLATNNHVEFDTITNIIGTGITLDTGADQADGYINLPANGIYMVISTLSCSFTTVNGYFNPQWQNYTDTANIGERGNITGYGAYGHVSMQSGFINTSGGSKKIRLRIAYNANMVQIKSKWEGVTCIVMKVG